MEKEMKKVPAVRFKGFTGDWEQRKLGEIIVDYVEKKHKNEELPILTSSRNGIENQKDHFGSIQQHDISDYNVIPKGYCTYRNRSDDRLFTFNVNKIAERGLVSKFYPVFSLKNADVDFFTNYLNNSSQLIKEFSVRAVGTSQVVLSLNELKKVEILIPVKKEQEHIGDLLRNFDNLITLHQRKSDQLKKLKAYFLQNLFPAKGEKVPKIRFKGFTGEWEERKLGELAEFNPKSVMPDKFEYVDLESVVGTEIVAHRTETKATAPSRAQRLAEIGDVFYQTVRPYQRNNCLFSIDDEAYVFSTGYAQMRPYGDSYFLLTLLQKDEFVTEVLNRCTGTSYPAINSNVLASLIVKYPVNVDEQAKIGIYFKNLDTIITLHQQKITQLQAVKKFLLQNLFV